MYIYIYGFTQRIRTSENYASLSMPPTILVTGYVHGCGNTGRLFYIPARSSWSNHNLYGTSVEFEPT